MKEISIIIPTFNEKENIHRLIKNIKKVVPKAYIVIVDDSIDDEIGKIVKKNKYLNVNYYHRKNAKGRGSAVLFGLRKNFSKDKKRIFIEMDADFSHRPIELKKNIELFKKKNYDLLISSRYLKKSKIINWPISRKIFSKLSNILAQLVLRVNVSDYTNGFRIYSSNAVNIILKKCGKIGDGFIILSEFLLALNINKLRIGETNTIFVNRIRGESSVNFKLIVNSFVGLIKLFVIKKRYKIKK
tara:strand:+ start:955 stop:1683 length:729 start_codon:yes stop_codon:yes gene_type:complete